MNPRRPSLYRRLLRPLLFRLDPETAHELTVAAAERAGRSAWVRARLARVLRVDDPALSVSVAGLRFENPVGLAAGFDKDCRLSRVLPALGFGFAELGTVTPRPQTGRPKPRLFRVPESDALLNRMGFNGAGAAAAASRLAAAGRCAIPLGLNVGMNADTPAERAHVDYGEAFSALRPHGDFFVVNVSSPNTAGLRRLQDRFRLERILKELHGRDPERKPVFVKLAPDLQLEELRDLMPVLLAEAQGLVIANTTVSRDAVPQRWASEPGGVSGAPLRDLSTRLIYEAYRLSEGRLPIVGVGGVFSAEDAWRKICAGASLIEVYTGLVYRGPGLVREINEGLSRILREQGHRSLAEAVGKRHRGAEHLK